MVPLQMDTEPQTRGHDSSKRRIHTHTVTTEYCLRIDFERVCPQGRRNERFLKVQLRCLQPYLKWSELSSALSSYSYLLALFYTNASLFRHGLEYCCVASLHLPASMEFLNNDILDASNVIPLPHCSLPSFFLFFIRRSLSVYVGVLVFFFVLHQELTIL